MRIITPLLDETCEQITDLFKAWFYIWLYSFVLYFDTKIKRIRIDLLLSKECVDICRE